MKYLFVASLLLSSSAFAAPRMAEFCKARIYAKVDKKFPKNVYLTAIKLSKEKNVYDLEVSKDLGEFNMCIKNMQIKVLDADKELCDIGAIQDDPTNQFDCG